METTKRKYLTDHHGAHEVNNAAAAPRIEVEATHTPTPWLIARQGDSKILYSDFGRQYEGANHYVAFGLSDADAALIVKAVNSHQALVDALKLLVAMDNCNYELETMRRSGLFEQVKDALKIAGE